MTNKPSSDPKNYAPIISTAEAILSDRFGAPVRLSNVECLSEEERRNLLLRCQVGQTASTGPSRSTGPSSVIIKQVLAGNSEHNPGEYNPSDLSSWHTTRFYSDWIGAEFLSLVSDDAAHGPRFYGGHQEQGFIILEDLGSELGSLVEPLLEGDAQRAETALLTFANRLGRMHADSVGKVDQYRALAAALHPDLMDAQKGADEKREAAAKLIKSLGDFGLQTEPTFASDLAAVVDSILDPGPFLAYAHLDPCPDNIIYQHDRLRLIDFEFGQMGHALLDITYGRMIMPTCWCCNRMPPKVVEEMESVYRTQLAVSCPQAEDDQLFEAALVNVCGYWLSNTLNWLLPNAQEKDDEWGIATVRPRILARIEAFVDIAEKTGQLPGYRSTASRLHEALCKRWPDVEPLPLYPAFRA